MAIPKKIDDRIKVGLKKYQPVLANAKLRDVGEADTVTIIKDMLSDVFGYDKYVKSGKFIPVVVIAPTQFTLPL